MPTSTLSNEILKDIEDEQKITRRDGYEIYD